MRNVWSSNEPPYRNTTMTTYYVATLARYVLVDAETEAEARTKGHAALYDIYADLREQLGREVPINIQLCRPAAADEIALMRYHRECLAADMPRG